MRTPHVTDQKLTSFFIIFLALVRFQRRNYTKSILKLNKTPSRTEFFRQRIKRITRIALIFSARLPLTGCGGRRCLCAHSPRQTGGHTSCRGSARHGRAQGGGSNTFRQNRNAQWRQDQRQNRWEQQQRVQRPNRWAPNREGPTEKRREQGAQGRDQRQNRWEQ